MDVNDCHGSRQHFLPDLFFSVNQAFFDQEIGGLFNQFGLIGQGTGQALQGQGKALRPVFEDVFNELAQLYQMDPDEKHRSSSMLLLNLITQYITDKDAGKWIKSYLEKMSKADLNEISKVLSNLIAESEKLNK